MFTLKEREEKANKVSDVRIDNRTPLSALIYRCENGCKRRSLPQRFGNRHVIYVRLNRLAKKGVLERVYKAMGKVGRLQAFRRKRAGRGGRAGSSRSRRNTGA
ncbi:MAG: transposase [Treponema sp.]|nr:transposase [Treponema sp.]